MVHLGIEKRSGLKTAGGLREFLFALSPHPGLMQSRLHTGEGIYLVGKTLTPCLGLKQSHSFYVRLLVWICDTDLLFVPADGYYILMGETLR